MEVNQNELYLEQKIKSDIKTKENLKKVEWDILSLLKAEGEMRVVDVRDMLESTDSKIKTAINSLSYIEGLSLYEGKDDGFVTIGIEHCKFELKPCSPHSQQIVIFGKRRIIFRSLRDASKKLQKDRRTLIKLIDEGSTLLYKGDVYFIDELP